MGATFLRTWLLLGSADRAASGTERKLRDLNIEASASTARGTPRR